VERWPTPCSNFKLALLAVTDGASDAISAVFKIKAPVPFSVGLQDVTSPRASQRAACGVTARQAHVFQTVKGKMLVFW
jgi:hypothetical protein